ncbi:hypothetical protein AHF37_01515 [Paragonimus kellicotti]|nr:hypothetical protein AHF37_01515 [Paragonimus kellicotti]
MWKVPIHFYHNVSIRLSATVYLGRYIWWSLRLFCSAGEMALSNDVDISEEKLKEVDKVLELIRGLNSKDEKKVGQVMKVADEYLVTKNSGFSKTCINTTGTDRSSSSGACEEHQSTAGVASFMRAIEMDACERAERRTRQRLRAEQLKERANTFFKAGDWHRAIELYTEAIELSKDWDVLYTNRALAYIRSGASAAALSDCDTALRLLSFGRSDVSHSPKVSGQPNTQLAKTYFQKGKALMALGRPDEALTAYSHSRIHSLSASTASGKLKDAWPAYLAEYVTQAEVALAVQQADAKAEADFEACSIRYKSQSNGSVEKELPTGQQLVCLLAQLARRDQDLNYYSAGLRQLARLLACAPREVPAGSLKNGCLEVCDDEKSGLPSPRPQQYSQHRGRRKKKSVHRNRKLLSLSSDQPPHSESVETLSDLQTLFRVKKGFSLLGKEVDAICESLNGIETQRVDQAGASASVTCEPSKHTTVPNGTGTAMDCADRLLALLNLTDLLATECAENQRILIGQHPKLVDITLSCMTLASDFVEKITKAISELSQLDVLSLPNLEQRKRHKLEALRGASSNLLATLTSQPSGRQAVLNVVRPDRLFDTLAVCLAESFGRSTERVTNSSENSVDLRQRLQSVLGSSMSNKPQNLPSSLAVSVIHAAKAAQILENLTESPGFLVSARSSISGLVSLLTVIEAAISVAPGNSSSSSRSITTTTRCLASLLDSLSTACHDNALRTDILRHRQPLLIALADCLLRHATLFTDPGHAQLVGSACRLLHNIFVGHVWKPVGDQFLSSDRLTDKLLAGVGAVLDQPGHGPELRAVATALAGRILPLCSANRVLSWLGENDEHNALEIPGRHICRMPSERSRLLLAILDACSLPNGAAKESARQDPTDCAKDQDQLSVHLFSGCIRCLAAATKHSYSMRYAIGDDRRRVRRLARIIRAKLPLTSPQVGSKSAVCSAPPAPRDEPMAGNACLILQYCCDDTPLAEHLQGTSVILDLLQLIQESQQVDTKRNAAILIGKLAQANHDHRNELSRLDGWSVLTPFNSWNTTFGQ